MFLSSITEKALPGTKSRERDCGKRDLGVDWRVFLIQGLNFAPTPSWNSKTETTEWLNLQSHIGKLELNNVLSFENNENNNQ